MAGIDEPNKALLRRKELSSWLGLADHEITKLIRDGVLKPRYFRENSRAFFIKREIEETLLNLPQEVSA